MVEQITLYRAPTTRPTPTPFDPYDRETGNTMLGARLPDGERGLDHLHVPLLDRVLGTWADHDGRWPKRVTVLGQPALVSVPGLYEAPAKPEQCYKQQQKQALFGGGGPPPREVPAPQPSQTAGRRPGAPEFCDRHAAQYGGP